MHSSPSSMPAFLTKLRRLVDDPETDDIIHWDYTGESFHIRDANRLAKDLLHLYYKHSNMTSFIRQLNMYGFRKVNRNDSVVANPNDPDNMEFHHPYFQRDNVDLMNLIQRKQPSYNTETLNVRQNPTCGGDVDRVFIARENPRLAQTLRQMKSRQDIHGHQINILRTENQLMIRQINRLQDAVNRQSTLISTLFNVISAFTGPRGTGLRFGSSPRKLAITDSVDAANRSCLEYNINPKVLSEGVRLVASNPELKKMVFDPSQLHTISSGLPEDLAGPSTSTAIAQVSPYLALQGSASSSSRKRSRFDNTPGHNGQGDLFDIPFDENFDDAFNTASPPGVLQDVSNPRDESSNQFDEDSANDGPDCRLSDIEPSIFQIEGLTDMVMENSNESNAIEPLPVVAYTHQQQRQLPRRRGRKSNPTKFSPRRRMSQPVVTQMRSPTTQSPMLANVDNPAESDVFPWNEEDGSLEQKLGGDADTLEEVVLSPSNEQADIFEKLFGPSPFPSPYQDNAANSP